MEWRTARADRDDDDDCDEEDSDDDAKDGTVVAVDDVRAPVDEDSVAVAVRWEYAADDGWEKECKMIPVVGHRSCSEEPSTVTATDRLVWYCLLLLLYSDGRDYSRRCCD